MAFLEVSRPLKDRWCGIESHMRRFLVGGGVERQSLGWSVMVSRACQDSSW